MSASLPEIITRPIFDIGDQPAMKKFHLVSWENCGKAKLSIDGNIFKARFGRDIGVVLAFLDKQVLQTASEASPLLEQIGAVMEKLKYGSHASVNYGGEDGFIIISRGQLHRLGVTLKPKDPTKTGQGADYVSTQQTPEP